MEKFDVVMRDAAFEESGEIVMEFAVIHKETNTTLHTEKLKFPSLEKSVPDIEKFKEVMLQEEVLLILTLKQMSEQRGIDLNRFEGANAFLTGIIKSMTTPLLCEVLERIKWLPALKAARNELEKRGELS